MRRLTVQRSLLLLLICLSLIIGGCTGTGPKGTKGESVYDRVIREGRIRVGYVTYPPGCIKDPNTGKLSGVFVDTLEEAAKNLELKVDWTEEVGWGSMIEGLQADRYDLIGSAVWATSSRGKLVDFSIPLFYSVLGAYVRTNDNRFNDNLGAINSGSVKIATIDGEISDIVAKSQFPQAQRVSLPQLSDVSQVLLNVIQNKADVALVEPYLASEFLKNNPGTVKNIVVEKPILFAGNHMMFKRGETEFKSMLDTALEEVINKGFVDSALDKYDPNHTFYRLSYPFRLPTARANAAGAR